MRDSAVDSWVVYLAPLKNCPDGVRAMCGQAEWEEMERSKPGHYTLIQKGITNEGEAERLARGSSGESKARATKPRPRRVAWEEPSPETESPAASTQIS